jgi:hypothetical protein
MQRQLYLDQTRISHIVESVWFEGKVMKGIVETAVTSVGKDMCGLINQGSAVAFSMRGIGPLTEQKGDILHVNKPLSIFAYDWVIHPSHSIAYMEKVLTESTVNMLTGKDQFALSEASDFDILDKNEILFNEGMVMPITEYQIKDYIKNESKNFRALSEQFNISSDANITLEESNSLVSVQQGSEILKIYLEDYISYEIDNYLIHKL